MSRHSGYTSVAALVLAAAALLGMPRGAFAVVILVGNGGSDPFLIEDNGPIDQNPATGLIEVTAVETPFAIQLSGRAELRQDATGRIELQASFQASPITET